MSVVLAGPFGQSNPGDEALLRAFVEALPGRRLVATSSDPVGTEAVHGIAAMDRADERAIARAIAGAEGVVFAGGTVFKTLHPSSARRPLELLASGMAVALATRALGVPLALVGVGAGAIEGRRARSLARGIVRCADLLILRDEESAGVLAAAGAPTPFRVGADAAWTTLEAPAAPSAAGDAVIVALSCHAGGPGLAERLVHVLAPVARAGLRVRLQPWQALDGVHDDLGLARGVAARLAGDVEIVPPPADLADARDLFAGARLVVALRFHALLAAAAAGVPAAVFAHEPKLAGLGRRLEQGVIAPAGSADAAAAAVLAALDRPPPSPEAIARERSRALDGMALLRVVLSGGRSEEAAGLDGLELAPEAWVA